MSSKLRTVLKIILILIGSMVLLLFLFFVGIGAYMAYGSHRADAAAKAFCGTVAAGADFNAVSATAKHTAYPNRMLSPEPGQYVFVFQGGIFHAGECRVRVLDDKVVAVNFAVNDY